MFKFINSWFERNAGKSILECSMDTSGTLQGPLVNVFDGCWIKLDGSGNECIVYSSTQNFNVAFDNCAGTGFSSKSLFKIDGLQDNYLPYLVSFSGNRFVGFNLISNNSTFNAEIASTLVSVRNNAGVEKGRILSSGEDVSLRANRDFSIESTNGTPMLVVSRRASRGTEIIGYSPNGTQYVMRVPNGGGAATWTQV